MDTFTVPSTRSMALYIQHHLRPAHLPFYMYDPQVTGNSGFEWINEAQGERPKWGYVAAKAGSSIKMHIDTTASASHVCGSSGSHAWEGVPGPHVWEGISGSHVWEGVISWISCVGGSSWISCVGGTHVWEGFP